MIEKQNEEELEMLFKKFDEKICEFEQKFLTVEKKIQDVRKKKVMDEEEQK